MVHDCRLCQPKESPDQKIILRNDTVLFVQNEKEQGVAATFALLKQVKAGMDEHYHPDGYNVGWNCWPAGGQVDMHAHMHVMPRFRQEPYAGRGIRFWLKQPTNRWG